MSAPPKADENKQVKSKERIQKHGEVFTPQWVVNDMLNLLPADVWQPGKTFLEPACGEGAFLVEIYKRKLQIIIAETQNEWEWQAAIATSSIYGIELLEDNTKQCKKNLKQVFREFYRLHYPDTQNEEVKKAIHCLIKHNIVQGNALTCRKCTIACGNKCSTCEKITFSEWTPLENYQFKRQDYTYEGVLKINKFRETSIGKTVFESITWRNILIKILNRLKKAVYLQKAKRF